MIYRCFLYLEHTYNNPVANAFVALLLDRVEQEKGALTFGQGNYAFHTHTCRAFDLETVHVLYSILMCWLDGFEIYT